MPDREKGRVLILNPPNRIGRRVVILDGAQAGRAASTLNGAIIGSLVVSSEQVRAARRAAREGAAAGEIAGILGCSELEAARVLAGWPPGPAELDPRHGDPRFAEDSGLWERLLAETLLAAPPLALGLRRLRAAGARLVARRPAGYRITPVLAPVGDWASAADYRSEAERLLGPYRDELTRLLGSVAAPADGRDGESRHRPSPGPVRVDWSPPDEWRTARDPEELRRLRERAVEAGLCGLDLETAPPQNAASLPAPWRERAQRDPHLARPRLLQIAMPGEPPLLFDLSPWWGRPEALGALLAPVRELLADPNVLKVGHNLKFDLKILRAACGGSRLEARALFDTMLAAQLLACGLPPPGPEPFGLAAVAERFLGARLDKAEQRSDWLGLLSEAQLRYAAADAAVLPALAGTLRSRLAAEGLERAAALEFECLPATADMEYAGMPFDAERLAALEREEEAALAEAEARLLALAPAGSARQEGLFGAARATGFNPDNPDHALAALRRLGARAADTRDETLAALARAGGPAGEFAAALRSYRKHAKALSSFVRPYARWRHPATGRIHAEYRQLCRNGVGRLAAKDPNIQQVPRDPRFRGMFAAPPGRALVVADYGAIEMRVMAWLSRDPVLMEVFREGADPHRRTAALVMGKVEEAVTRSDRQKAKAVNFGLIYGMSAEGLRAYARDSYGVDMTSEEAAAWRDRFFGAYRGVAAWHRRQDREARRARETQTASGRIRRWRSSRMPATELFNTPDQGTGADILKRAMALVRHALNGIDAEIAASVHDELVVECGADEADAVAEIVRREMVRAGEEFISPVPVEVEARAARSWAEK